MALYIIDKNKAEFALNLASIDESAKIVLIQDGVYLDISQFKKKNEVYYVEDDVKIRGIEPPSGTGQISYDNLIEMMVDEKVYSFI